MNPQELNLFLVLFKKILIERRVKKSPDQLNDKDKLLEDAITKIQGCESSLNAYNKL